MMAWPSMVTEGRSVEWGIFEVTPGGPLGGRRNIQWGNI